MVWHPTYLTSQSPFLCVDQFIVVSLECHIPWIKIYQSYLALIPSLGSSTHQGILPYDQHTHTLAHTLDLFAYIVQLFLVQCWQHCRYETVNHCLVQRCLVHCCFVQCGKNMVYGGQCLVQHCTKLALYNVASNTVDSYNGLLCTTVVFNVV